MKTVVALLLAVGLGPRLVALAQVHVQHLRCENLTNPIGLDVARPRWARGSTTSRPPRLPSP